MLKGGGHQKLAGEAFHDHFAGGIGLLLFQAFLHFDLAAGSISFLNPGIGIVCATG